MAIDLNSKSMLSDRINLLIDTAIEKERAGDAPREYLGASVVGDPCERRVQYEWLAIRGEIPRQRFSAQTLRRFDRGNIYEARAKSWLEAAGFMFVTPGKHLSFTDFDGRFRGHVDGVIGGFYYPASTCAIPLPCLWECKCLASKGAKAVAKDGLKKYSSAYFAQVHLYMAYLNLSQCLFTVVNADDMTLGHYLIPFDAAEAEATKGKVGRVFQSTGMGELLPRCTQDPAFFLCGYCPYRENCWK